jgi:hypothetical protein
MGCWRGSHESEYGIKKGHNSVTVQNRTYVYVNFFDYKDVGNHLLQFCPKVVKHPVYTLEVQWYQTHSRNKQPLNVTSIPHRQPSICVYMGASQCYSFEMYDVNHSIHFAHSTKRTHTQSAEMRRSKTKK